jgi:ribose-phosphate pyrophosphokinase
MKIDKYPDGSSYVTLNKPFIEEENQIFRINSYVDLWHLNQFVDAFNNATGEKPTITIPNLIDAQADRRFKSDQSSGLKLVCAFLNHMNANFRIFHPHNAEVVEALMDNVEIIDNTRYISYVLKEIEDEYPDVLEDKIAGPEGYYRDGRLDDNLILMSSDAGGFKPLMKLCDKIGWKGDTESCSKSRFFYENGKSKLIQKVPAYDMQGKDVLIIDDISVYGGTFKGLSKLLKERNCGKLYLAVSHMTVQDLKTDPVIDYFDKVFITNSKFDKYYIEGTKITAIRAINNLEIIKLF